MDQSLLNEIKILSRKLRDSQYKNKDILSKITELCENFAPVTEDFHMNGQDFNVLVVDDDPVFCNLTTSMVEQIPNREIFIDCECNYNKVLEKICSGDFDVVILDYYLDDFTGIEVLNAVGKMGCETPIILLTGEGNIDIDIRAMEAGAYDFLHKADITPTKLERSLRYTIKNYQAYKIAKQSKDRYMELFGEVLSLLK